MPKRGNHHAGFKARVMLEAVEGARTVSELAAGYGVHPTMTTRGRNCCWAALRISSRGAAERLRRWMKKQAGHCAPRSESWSSPTIFSLMLKPWTGR